MINILAHIPNRHDATCYYRAMPLMALRKTTRDFQIHFAGEISFSTAMQMDLAFFQRPSTPSELEAIRIFKRLGIPVIVDFDDLLFDIPVDNPAYQHYMNKPTQTAIVNIIREADCVWVSTKELKRCLQIPKAPLNERVYVVPNALDDTHLVRGQRSTPVAPDRRQPAVLWRGSATHERDVMEFSPELGEIAAKYAKWSFVFAGWNPWFLTERMRKTQAIVSGALPVGEFMDFVYATGPQIGVVPLHESRFNRCKSNIAWLEMTWAGAACLVPDWEEWQNPGSIAYSNPDDFKEGLTTLLEMTREQRSELNRQSWEHIQNHFMLSRVNYWRHQTIRAALGDMAWPEGHAPIHDEDVVAELQ